MDTKHIDGLIGLYIAFYSQHYGEEDLDREETNLLLMRDMLKEKTHIISKRLREIKKKRKT